MSQPAAPPAPPPSTAPPAAVVLSAAEATPQVSATPDNARAVVSSLGAMSSEGPPSTMAAPPATFTPTPAPRLSELPEAEATTAAALQASSENGSTALPAASAASWTDSQPSPPSLPETHVAVAPPAPELASTAPGDNAQPSDAQSGQADWEALSTPQSPLVDALTLAPAAPPDVPAPSAISHPEPSAPTLQFSPAANPTRPEPTPTIADLPAAETLADGAVCDGRLCPDSAPFASPLPPVEPLSPPAATDSIQTSPSEASPAPPTADPSSPAPATDQSGSTAINTIAVQGSSIFDQAAFDQALQPFLGRPLSAAEQLAAADAITQLYLDQGYITSRAYLENPAVQNGALQIRVLEGRLERIDILGVERLSEDYVRSRIELAAGSPVSSARLEDQLRLMRESPLLDNIEASLRAGSTVDSSILTVRVDEADPWDAFVGVDNHSSSLVGTEQFNLAVAHQNLTGRGDRLGASFQRTFLGGSSTFDVGYSIPVNPMEGTLQLQASFERSRIPVVPGLNIDGEAEEYTLRFRQPLVRTLQEEFALSLAFDYRDGQTFLGNIPFGFGAGPDPITGVSRTSALRFGQDYVRRDVQGAWSLRSQFSLGVPVFGATVNPAPIPDSQFFSWLGQAQRVQRLNDNHLLIMQADLQLSPSSLLPSEQFALGGWASVRGYRQNIRAGDNGLRLSVEDRITLQRNEAGLPTLQLAPFAEVGTVWNSGGNPNPLPSQNLLAGLGLGLLWEPVPNLNLRVDCALPLINLPNRGNALQEQGVYFQIGYRI